MVDLRGAAGVIERFINDFTWKRLAVWGGILALIVAGASLYEWYTHDFRLARLSEQIDLLERLQETTPGGARDTAVAAVYESVRAQVRASVEQGAKVPGVAAQLWHGVAGFLPWALMALFLVSRPGEERIEDAGAGAVAFLLLGLASAWAVTLQPATWPTVVTHVVAPVAIPLIFVLVASGAGSAT